MATLQKIRVAKYRTSKTLAVLVPPSFSANAVAVTVEVRTSLDTVYRLTLGRDELADLVRLAARAKSATTAVPAGPKAPTKRRAA